MQNLLSNVREQEATRRYTQNTILVFANNVYDVRIKNREKKTPNGASSDESIFFIYSELPTMAMSHIVIFIVK